MSVSMSARRTAFALACTALAWLAAAPANATNIQRVISPGGIEAWLVRDATVPLLAMDYAFVGGAAQDPPGKPGVGNMMASLLDEGAGELDSAAFRDRLDRRAIDLNFSITRDYLRGSLRTLIENRDEAFDLLRLALTVPRFDKEPLERTRAQILSGLRRETSSPNSIASRRFWHAAYGDHPYGRPSNGTLESVPTISADDLRAYTKRILARDTLKVAVVGDIDPLSLGRMLDSVFGALPAKSERAPIAPVKAGGLGQRVAVTLDVPQTVVTFGAPGITRADPDFMTAYVLNHILGGGTFSSRLYREVREKRGYVYSVSTGLVWMQQSDLFFGSTATRSDRTEDTIATITDETRKMAEGPTQQELDEAKDYLKGSQMLALDTSSKIASQLVQYQLDNLGIDYIEKRNALIDAVTLEHAKRVAKRLWATDLLFTVVGRATPPRSN